MTLVYSTETGRIKPEEEKVARPKGDGIVRIQRQTKGRKGKGVCIVSGLDLDDEPLKLLAAELKKKYAVVAVQSKMAPSKFKVTQEIRSKRTLKRKA